MTLLRIGLFVLAIFETSILAALDPVLAYASAADVQTGPVSASAFDRTVYVKFNQALETNSAAEPGHYQIPGVQVTNACIHPAGDQVILTLDQPLSRRTLRVIGVKDFTGSLLDGQVQISTSRFFSRDVGVLNDPGGLSDPQVPGSAFITGPGEFEVFAGGSDIWFRDGFHFVFEEVEGDFDVRVRVSDVSKVDNWSAAGLMIREDLDPDSRNVNLRVETELGTDAYVPCVRAVKGGNSVLFGIGVKPVSYPNAWLRLIRRGAAIIAYRAIAAEPVSWIKMGQVITTPPYPKRVYVGLCTCGHGNAPGRFTVAHYHQFDLHPLTAPVKPPQVLGACAFGRNLYVRFDEPLDDDSVALTNHYQLPGTRITNAWLHPAGDEIVLSLEHAVARPVLQFAGIKGYAGRAAAGTVDVVSSDMKACEVGGNGPPGSPSDLHVPGAVYFPAPDELEVYASGTNIWDTSDDFYFIYRVIHGDFDVSVRVSSVSLVDEYSAAGLMVREDLEPDSRNVNLRVEAEQGTNRYVPCVRLVKGGISTLFEPLLKPVSYPNAWLRLVRTGNRITAYRATTAEPASWEKMGEVVPDPPYPDQIFVGLCACGHSNASREYSVSHLHQLNLRQTGTAR